MESFRGHITPLKYVGKVTLCFDVLKVFYLLYLDQFSYMIYLVQCILSTKIYF